MPGPSAEVLRRLGAIVVTLPGGEIVPALKSGAIDASEWACPWLDMALGLHKAVGYYYYPGFHEPGTATAVGINKGVWADQGQGSATSARGRGLAHRRTQDVGREEILSRQPAGEHRPAHLSGHHQGAMDLRTGSSADERRTRS